MKEMMNAMDRCGWASVPGCVDVADALRLRNECQIAYDGEMHTVSYVLHDHYFNQLRPAAGFVPGAADPENATGA